MFVAHHCDLISVGAVLVWQLDADIVVVTDTVDGGPLAANDVGVVFGLHMHHHGEATQLLGGGGGSIQCNLV